MARIVGTVSALFNAECKASRIRKKGCSVSLKGVPRSHLIIDLDKLESELGENGACCDYLFIADRDSKDWVVLLELKKGDIEASKTVQQLQAGAEVAQRYVQPNEAIEFYSVVASGNLHKAERNKLRNIQNKVSFHGHVSTIIRIKCGGVLWKTLNS